MHVDLVIVGGGAGGLILASRLGRALGRRSGPERVLLVDRGAFHIWKPTLHEVAAGTLNAHQEGLSYTILARRNHFSFTLGDIESLDAPGRTLTLREVRDADGRTLIPQRTLSFRWLVLAIGSGSNFFGTPGAEHAYVLEQAQDAERFHHQLLAAFTRAAFAPDKRLGVAIVGAGATGVELAAELIEAHQELLAGLGSEQRFRLDIRVVEAGPRILGGLPEKISQQATVALQRKQVQVMTGTKVLEIRPDRLVTSAGELPADLIVWAAGIKAAEANTRFGLATNRAHQFIVDARLRTTADGVHALGDCAACAWPSDAPAGTGSDGRSDSPSATRAALPPGSSPAATSPATPPTTPPAPPAGAPPARLVPARAQAAHQQASWLAGHLLALMHEREPQGDFVYRDFGSLVSLGDNRGVGNLMGGLAGRNFFVEGLVAKWMYMSLHLNHHRAIVGLGNTVLLALARLLQRRVSGRLKLH
ncbi:MAG: hypothetical protein RIQ53_4393 [Pseudomonadota bacterium]|jgi:NADH dehydrogenase